MTDIEDLVDDEEEIEIGDPAEARLNVIIYILYLVMPGITLTGIIGVILAYLKRNDNDLAWVDTHFTWQIRSFWIGLLLVMVGGLLSPILIGVPILFFAVVWWLIRAVRGLLWVIDGVGVPHPESWMFGTEVGEGPAARNELVP